MKLSLIYHVHKNITNLEKSLKSLIGQTDKDFEFILVNDGASHDVVNILKKYNFDTLCNGFKYIYFNENQGHSISFNEAIKCCKNDYVYYFGSNVILESNFIKKINDAINGNDKLDVISFTHVIKKSFSNKLFTTLNSDLKYSVNPSIRDKVFSREFLINNNIYLNENGYFPLIFLYDVMRHFKNWLLINGNIVQYVYNNNFTYNLYDIFQMNDLLIKNHSKTAFWKNNKDLIEFLMILYVTRIFLSRIFLSYKDKHTRKGSLSFSKNWLTINIPNWKNNIILNSKKADLSEESRQRVLNIFDRSFFRKIFGGF